MSDPRSPRVRSAEETILDLHAKIESDAKVIAALREALEMIAGRRQSGMAANDRLVHEFSMENPMSDIPHTPWFIRVPDQLTTAKPLLIMAPAKALVLRSPSGTSPSSS